MSLEGIHEVAYVLTVLQVSRGKLLKMGTKPGRIDKQDIRLGQLLEDAKDHIKVRFAEITLEKDNG